jgi:hypothetical protein
MQDPIHNNRYPRPHEVSLYRRALVDAMATESGEGVIKALNQHPRIQFLYAQDARVFEQYTIREHTEMVVRQYATFFARHELPAGMQRGEFLLTLALHDAGKPIPEDKRDQHRATLDLMHSIRDQLPYTSHGYELAQFLIGNDLLGKFIQSTLLTRSSLDTRERLINVTRKGQLTKSDVEEMANQVTFVPLDHLNGCESFSSSIVEVASEVYKASSQLSVSAHQLFDLLVTYYQCDTSAYTASARTFDGKAACPGLDFLFVRNDPTDPNTYLSFCDEKRRFNFVPYLEVLLEKVKSSLALFAPIEVTEAKGHRP